MKLTKIAIHILAFAWLAALPRAAAVQLGQVRQVTLAPASPVTAGTTVTVIVAVRGICPEIEINFGDGAVQTFVTSTPPLIRTHTYASVGVFTVAARGVGNCRGAVSTALQVVSPHVGLPLKTNQLNADLSLIPLALVNVAVDGVARPFGSPLGTPLGTIPLGNPEFSVARTAAKLFTISTSGGMANVLFSHTLPAGVPAEAFQWVQNNASAPNAKGQLRYNGCASCPPSFTLGINALSNTSVGGQINIKVVVSTGRPVITSITRNGGTDVEPRFEVRFTAGTFDPSESEAIATYADGLKYRLLPEGFNAATGSILAVIPRLKRSPSVGIVLRNAYGSSNPRGVELPFQGSGPGRFDCVNCSTVFGDANIRDQYSVKHSNSVPQLATGSDGSDDIAIAPAFSGTTPCNQHDFIYTGARVRWIRDDGYSGDSDEQGTVTVSSQPPVDQVLRSPANRIRIAWHLNPLKAGDIWYQIAFGFIEVVGVCPDRVVP